MLGRNNLTALVQLKDNFHSTSELHKWETWSQYTQSLRVCNAPVSDAGIANAHTSSTQQHGRADKSCEKSSALLFSCSVRHKTRNVPNIWEIPPFEFYFTSNSKLLLTTCEKQQAACLLINAVSGCHVPDKNEGQ